MGDSLVASSVQNPALAVDLWENEFDCGPIWTRRGEGKGTSGIDYQWVRFGSDCVRRHSSTGGGDVVPGLLTVVGQISRNLVEETVPATAV